MSRSGLLVALLGLAGLASVGCKDMRYYDVTVKFDGTTISASAASLAETCHVYVSGADSGDFYFGDAGGCGVRRNGLILGAFEYSSNADSGELTFTVKAYDGTPEDTQCLYGQGATTIKVGATTVSGEVVIAATGGGGC